MGGDGGVVARRSDLVRARSAADDAKRATLASRARWTTCFASGEPLREPVVVCAGGNLMLKDAVIERHLLRGRALPSLAHVRSLADLVDVTLAPAPAGSGAVFACPVTGALGAGRAPFVVMRACGCAVAERAAREVPPGVCAACGAARGEGGGGPAEIPVLPPPAEAARLVAEHEERRALRRRGRKKAKRGRGADDGGGGGASATAKRPKQE